MPDTLESTPTITDTDTNPPEIDGDDLRRAAEALDRAAHSIDDSIDAAGIKSITVPENEISLDSPESAQSTSDSTPLPEAVPVPTSATPSKPNLSDDPIKEITNPVEFLGRWNQNLTELRKEHPDLLNKDSELFRATSSFVDSKDPEIRRMLQASTKGPRYALELAKIKLEAEKSSRLAQENAELKARIKEQDRKLAPSAGTPTSGPQTKNFDQMNFEEQGSLLRRLAMEEDGLV